MWINKQKRSGVGHVTDAHTTHTLRFARRGEKSVRRVREGVRVYTSVFSVFCAPLRIFLDAGKGVSVNLKKKY